MIALTLASALLSTSHTASMALAQEPSRTFTHSSSRPSVAAIVPLAKATTYDTQRGPNATDSIVLTYDDCPGSVSSYKKMVDYASSHDIALVLFPTGQCVKIYKKRGFNLVSYARDRGIWVANHSFSHPLLTKLKKPQIVDQIDGTAVSNYGRPPYGGVNETVKAAYKAVRSYDRQGMRIWLWNVDTSDWKTQANGERPSSRTIVSRIMRAIDGGESILMHMQHKGFTPTTLRRIKEGLANKGLTLCRAWHGEDREGPIESTGRVVPDNIC
jgi:peptidoglycan/xylan/chitin deacetylase (PgdA/CDA1 family)